MKWVHDGFFPKKRNKNNATDNTFRFDYETNYKAKRNNKNSMFSLEKADDSIHFNRSSTLKNISPWPRSPDALLHARDTHISFNSPFTWMNRFNQSSVFLQLCFPARILFTTQTFISEICLRFLLTILIFIETTTERNEQHKTNTQKTSHLAQKSQTGGPNRSTYHKKIIRASMSKEPHNQHVLEASCNHHIIHSSFRSQSHQWSIRECRRFNSP